MSARVSAAPLRTGGCLLHQSLNHRTTPLLNCAVNLAGWLAGCWLAAGWLLSSGCLLSAVFWLFAVSAALAALTVFVVGAFSAQCSALSCSVHSQGQGSQTLGSSTKS